MLLVLFYFGFTSWFSCRVFPTTILYLFADQEHIIIIIIRVFGTFLPIRFGGDDEHGEATACAWLMARCPTAQWPVPKPRVFGRHIDSTAEVPADSANFQIGHLQSTLYRSTLDNRFISICSAVVVTRNRTNYWCRRINRSSACA